MIMIDRKELKARAREAMRQTRPHAVWVTLMVAAALIVVAVLWLRLSGYWDLFRTLWEIASTGEELAFAMPEGTDSLIGWLLTVALELMVLVLSLIHI